MNRYKKLINNSMIFAIGNFGSKLLQFLLIPLYSYTLTTSQFGKIDLIITLVSLLSPLVFFDIYDAVFRYALDNDVEVEKVFNTGFFFIISISTFLSILIFVGNFKNYSLVYLLLLFTSLYSLISNFTRSIGKTVAFAISGIIDALTSGILSVVFLAFFKLGVTGYLLSMIIGFVISIIYLLYVLSFRRLININSFSLIYLKKMLVYSTPLIPNTLAWWLNSSSDRYFILLFLGPSANGIYAMANKIPSMLNVLSNIFFQSWQIAVVEEYENKDEKHFISVVLNYFIALLFLCCLIVLGVIKPIFKIFISSNYYTAWTVTPFVLLSVVYSSISAFLGTIYTASKKTVPILISTLVGAISNIFLSIFFVKFIGINGAALANVFSFLIVSIIRYKELFALNKVMIRGYRLIFYHAIFLIASFLLFVLKDYIIYIFVDFIIIMVFLLCEKRSILNIVKLFRKLR